MAQATRELKRRIKGIANTKKVTKAMELVAASKMRRAVQSALATRDYSLRAWELLTNLAEVTDANLHPLLTRRAVKRGLLVVFTSDRGLAGGLNAQVIRQALEAAKAFGAAPFDVVSIGQKGQDALVRSGLSLVATFKNPARQPTLADILPIARIAIDGYISGQYDLVQIVSTDYLSPISQKPRQRTVLPISRQDLMASIEAISSMHESVKQTAEFELTEYLFEPTPDAVLEAMLVRLVEVQLYQALLEATASEHASRMVAMRNATDAATDLIDELTLDFNKARQAGITQDLAEISASRAALE